MSRRITAEDESQAQDESLDPFKSIIFFKTHHPCSEHESMRRNTYLFSIRQNVPAIEVLQALFGKNQLPAGFDIDSVTPELAKEIIEEFRCSIQRELSPRVEFVKSIEKDNSTATIIGGVLFLTLLLNIPVMDLNFHPVVLIGNCFTGFFIYHCYKHIQAGKEQLQVSTQVLKHQMDCINLLNRFMGRPEVSFSHIEHLKPSEQAEFLLSVFNNLVFSPELLNEEDALKLAKGLIDPDKTVHDLIVERNNAMNHCDSAASAPRLG